MSRPAPIRTDGSNDFASDTMRRRLPAIIDETIQLNADYSPGIRTRLEALRDEIASGAAIAGLERESGIDYHVWETAWDEQADKVPDDLTWHDIECFFAETYAYRRMMEAVRWYETGRDPFLPKKRIELESAALWDLLERALQPLPPAAELKAVLGFDLWANRIDLSYAAAMARGTDVEDDDLLVDGRRPLLAYLGESAGRRRRLRIRRRKTRFRGEGTVYIIADNAGSELALDLALADCLLRHVCPRVVLCLKAHPTFVSDATPADVWMMLAAMKKRNGACRELAERLNDAWLEDRLRFVPHLFWNSSAFLWNMPREWRDLLDEARLVIVKGDANYRRALGDCLWPVDTPLADVLNYIDAPTLCLRTLKSDPIVGLSAKKAAELDHADPGWRTNGKRGLIQFKPQTSNSQ